MKRGYIAVLAVLCAVAVLAMVVILVFPGESPKAVAAASPAAGSQGQGSWMDIPLTDAVTGESFTLRPQDHQPVLVSFFTVACPICTEQQRRITAGDDLAGRSYRTVGLDIDPRESPDLLKAHVLLNGFSGRYAASPRELTQHFITLYGADILTPAIVPTVVVCPDGSIAKLKNGLKSVEEIEGSVRSGCGA